MRSISFQELQMNLATLLDGIEAGEHMLLLRDGRPVAELSPIHTNRQTPRPIGLCAGAFTVPDDFDAPLPDAIIREFEGR